MKHKALLVYAVAMVLTVGSQAWADTIDWKGVTWDVIDGTAVVNGDGSLTLTSAVNHPFSVALHVNRLNGLEGVLDPWVQWSFEGHRADILIEQEDYPGPTVQAGSNWTPTTFAVTRYTAPDNSRPEEYFAGAEDSEPISHVVIIGKRTDGTVDAKFDSDPWATSEFLKTNVGGDWGFNDVYLRMRTAAIGDSVTFTDFQYGDGHVPEPVTMSLLALGGLALIRRRRTAK